MNRITAYYSDGMPPEGDEGDVPLEGSESVFKPRLADPYGYESSRRNDTCGARRLFSGLRGGLGGLFDSGAVIALTCGFLACWWILFFIAGHALKTGWEM